MENPSFDKDETLRKQKQLLLMKKNRLNSLVRLIDEILKGENAMSFKEFSQSEIENQSAISSMDQSYESGSSNYIGAAIQAYYHNV